MLVAESCLKARWKRPSVLRFSATDVRVVEDLGDGAAICGASFSQGATRAARLGPRDGDTYIRFARATARSVLLPLAVRWVELDLDSLL